MYGYSLVYCLLFVNILLSFFLIERLNILKNTSLKKVYVERLLNVVRCKLDSR